MAAALDIGELVHVVSRLVAPALALLGARRPVPGVERDEAMAALRRGRELLQAHPIVARRYGRRFGGAGELSRLLERAARG